MRLDPFNSLALLVPLLRSSLNAVERAFQFTQYPLQFLRGCLVKSLHDVLHPLRGAFNLCDLSVCLAQFTLEAFQLDFIAGGSRLGDFVLEFRRLLFQLFEHILRLFAVHGQRDCGVGIDVRHSLLVLGMSNSAKLAPPKAPSKDDAPSLLRPSLGLKIGKIR